MAVDPLDYLFLFWTGLCAAVYLLGNLYEQQIRSLINSQQPKTQIPNHRYSDHQQQHQQPWDKDYPKSAASDFDSKQQYSRKLQSTTNYPFATNSRQLEDQYLAIDRNEPSGYSSTGRQASQQETVGTIPTASGFNEDYVEWINNILLQFYSQPLRYGPLIAESFYRSLNEKLSSIISSSVEYKHLFIEFSGVDVGASSRPELANVRTENESTKSVSIISKIYNKCLILELSIRDLGTSTGQQLMGVVVQQEQHYELHLENLEGKLRTVVMPNNKLMVIQFVEKPDTKITLRLIDNLGYLGDTRGNNSNRSLLIAEDELVSLILQALTQVVVDVYFGDDPDFPRYKQANIGGYKQRLNQLKGSASEIKRQIKQDFFGSLSSSSDNKERKVFVKIIKATNINYNQTVTCLLELDSPSQQTLTSTKAANSNPVWDEHFLFVVNDKSSELVFELWDSLKPQTPAGSPDAQGANRRGRFFGGSQSSSGTNNSVNNQQHHQLSSQRLNKSELTEGGKLLGSARISVEDLRWKPAQRVQLRLESQGIACSSPVGQTSIAPCGELHVELMFLEHSTSSNSQSQRLSSVAQIQLGDVVSVDRKVTPSGFVITTTTVTRLPKGSSSTNDLNQHSSSLARRQQNQPSFCAGHLNTGQVSAAASHQRNPSPISLSSTEQSVELDEEHLRHSLGSQVSRPEVGQAAQALEREQHPDAMSTTTERQSQRRSRSRSRSFLRAIKKRFSFSRTRSRSVGAGGVDLMGDAGAGSSRRTSRSGSLASSSEASPNWRAKSVPSSREAAVGELPTIVISRGRGLSYGGGGPAGEGGVGGQSGASSGEPAAAAGKGRYEFGGQPSSQLVIECVEPVLGGAQPGQPQKSHLRYYAVPPSEAHKSKWRKRGTKLHLFEDHQFVACHLAGSSTCHLCGRVFSRRPGKQGYKCRNCHLLSHKQCHLKVDHKCPYASPDKLNLEYIDSEPPLALTRSSTLSGRNHPLPAGASLHKSASVDAPDQR